MISINPATGETIAIFEAHSSAEVRGMIETAESTFQSWRRTSLDDRGKALSRLAAALESSAPRLARLATQEMGKPIRQAEGELAKCAWVCRYYAERGAEFLEPESVSTEGQQSTIFFEPLGVTLAIMPWNFPYWQLFRFAAPAIMAGNTVLLKHASNVFGCAMAIEELFREAELPDGALQTLRVSSDAIESILDDARVKAVSLTGSSSAGAKVGSMAGARMKKSVLELGGSDAYLILEDADIRDAARKCAAGRMINNGQSCIAAKRFIVERSALEAFTQALTEEMRAFAIDDPLDTATKLGPLARADLRDELHRQVVDSLEAGAQLILGGELPAGPGFYYPPTVISGAPPGSPAYEEELFGPVASVIPASDESEAIRIANDTAFGLGGGVFTRDLQRGQRIAAQELEAGACVVNGCVASDPRLPFGGIKASGYGRELSRYGMLEFVNIKTVVVGLD